MPVFEHSSKLIGQPTVLVPSWLSSMALECLLSEPSHCMIGPCDLSGWWSYSLTDADTHILDTSVPYVTWFSILDSRVAGSLLSRPKTKTRHTQDASDPGWLGGLGFAV